ncbi:hypothetical protein J1605_018325 [Eschrichtius robustus]|uniref:Uncharacterized protein n=1 Tax=Eschrichtius robustus TaxID=9764 RepID=A0AB34HVX2_ESCRO|nr:hypothetical protein J1605_018325 [Eschrichtius robustus]
MAPADLLPPSHHQNLDSQASLPACGSAGSPGTRAPGSPRVSQVRPDPLASPQPARRGDLVADTPAPEGVGGAGRGGGEEGAPGASALAPAGTHGAAEPGGAGNSCGGVLGGSAALLRDLLRAGEGRAGEESERAGGREGAGCALLRRRRRRRRRLPSSSRRPSA